MSLIIVQTCALPFPSTQLRILFVKTLKGEFRVKAYFVTLTDNDYKEIKLAMLLITDQLNQIKQYTTYSLTHPINLAVLSRLYYL